MKIIASRVHICPVFLYLISVCFAFKLDRNDLVQNRFSPRIVGGFSASRGQFPYQVLFRERKSKGVHCGGAIIHSRFLLTAGHCSAGITDPSKLYAVLGVTDRLGHGDEYDLESIIVHPNFNETNVHNDISLIRTVKHIIFTAFVRPIALPVRNTPVAIPVIVSGWGQVSVSNLRIFNNYNNERIQQKWK